MSHKVINEIRTLKHRFLTTAKKLKKLTKEQSFAISDFDDEIKVSNKKIVYRDFLVRLDLLDGGLAVGFTLLLGGGGDVAGLFAVIHTHDCDSLRISEK